MRKRIKRYKWYNERGIDERVRLLDQGKLYYSNHDIYKNVKSVTWALAYKSL